MRSDDRSRFAYSPEEELKSPFLDEAIFEEPATEGESGLLGLQAASPFSRAFEEQVGSSVDEGPFEDTEPAEEAGFEDTFYPLTDEAGFETEAPYAEDEAESSAESSLPQAIVQIVKEEWEKWGRGSKKETDPSVTRYLQEYYSVGVRRQIAATDLRGRAWQAQHPWSAVFISYVMRKAGAGDAFRYSAAHATYVAAAKNARLERDASKFWGYSSTEVTPELGDLVCKDRKVCKEKRNGRCVRWGCGGTTYENLARGGSTHCDIVVGIDLQTRTLRVIGGNVNQSVGEKRIVLNSQGTLPERAGDGCRYIAVVKPPSGTLALPNTTDTTGSLASLPGHLAEAVRRGAITLKIATAILSGRRDLNELTNSLFYARHPELPFGYRIQPGETRLAQEWVRIRDQVVRPLLRKLSAAMPASAQEAYGDEEQYDDSFQFVSEEEPSDVAEGLAEAEFEELEEPEELLWDEREGVVAEDVVADEDLYVEQETHAARCASYDDCLDEGLRKLNPRAFRSPVSPTGMFDRANWILKRDPLPRFSKMLVLRPEKKPSEALKAIVDKSPTHWTMDCAYFVQVAHLYARSQSDPTGFDRQWQNKEFRLRFHWSSGAGLSQVKYYFRRTSKNSPWKALYNGKWQTISSKWNTTTILAAMPRGSRVMWTNELGRTPFVNENTVKVGRDQYRAFGYGTRRVLTGRQVALLLAAIAHGTAAGPIIADPANASAELRAYTDAHVFLKEAVSFRRP